MTLIELLFFVVAIALSIAFGRFTFVYIGWWSILPAPAAGFGFVYLLILALNRLLRIRSPGK
jgi:hypothetical protein